MSEARGRKSAVGSQKELLPSEPRSLELLGQVFDFGVAPIIDLFVLRLFVGGNGIVGSGSFVAVGET